jgi:hypothetical protein
MAITAAVTPQRLSWHDFRRVDELPDSSENAQIAPELNLPPRVAPVRGRDNKFRLPSFTIRVTLNRHDTMVVDDPDVMTDALLNHERGHLNIAFLIARQMARELSAVEADDTADLQAQYNEISSRLDASLQSLTAQYDTDTDHGRNSSGQQVWDTRIRNTMADPTSDL